MPSVMVRYRFPFTEDLVKLLCDALPDIVATALACEEGLLVAPDIEVNLEPMPVGMRSAYDLHVHVVANEYPARRTSLAARHSQIRDGIRALFAGHDIGGSSFGEAPQPRKAWLWVQLIPGKWSSIW